MIQLTRRLFLNPLRWLAACCAVLALQACGGQQPSGPTDDGPPTVVATVFADLSMIRSLAGDAVVAEPLAPADADPVFWTPGPEDLARMQQADLIVLHGAAAEPWRGTASLPESKVFVVAADVADQLIRKESVTHSHGPGGDHTHEGGADPHTWMDPVLAERHLTRIADRLAVLVPAAEERIRANEAQLRGELQEIRSMLAELPKPPEGQWMYGGSPGYGYLARSLGWQLQERHLNPEGGVMEPTNQHELGHLLTDLGDKPPALLLIAREPHAELRQVLEEAGLKLCILPTCAMAPTAGEVITVLRANVAILRAALNPE